MPGQGCLGREQADRLPVAGATWQVWTADHDESLAAEAFIGRYGAAPENVLDYQGHLWLGPVPETADSLLRNWRTA